MYYVFFLIGVIWNEASKKEVTKKKDWKKGSVV